MTTSFAQPASFAGPHHETAQKSLFDRALWVMPAVFATHIAEEWFGGFTRYAVEEMHGPPMSDPMFVLNNAVFMAILLGLSVWAARSRSRAAAFALFAWATGNLFWDFVVHLTFTVLSGHFSPGLVTATLFYYPIPFIFTAIAIREGRLSVRGAIGAYGIGALLMGLVLWGGLYHFAT
jgi:hypothetical protein